jgi:NitT/TauT family transport system substrate-binding protein
MSGRYNEHWTRRDFLKTAGLGGAGALLGLPSDALAAEPPPETTKIRLARTTSICQALQYVVEGMFEAEGFTVVQFVGNPAAADRTLVSGDAQMGLLFLGPFLLRLDEDTPLLILSGGHVGCLELVAHEPIRSVRDLKGRSVAVVALGNATHAFLAMITAYVGLDPRKDVTIVTHSPRESMRLFEEKKVDAYITFPPFAQELRAKKIGQVVVNSSVDRPWSQYFCCVVAGHQTFVRKTLSRPNGPCAPS